MPDCQPVTTDMPDCQPVTTADQVADLLALVAAANHRIAAEAGELNGAPTTVGLDALHRLRRLADELRPGVEARAQLSRVDPRLLLAGTSLWLARRQPPTREAAGRKSARSAHASAAARTTGESV